MLIFDTKCRILDAATDEFASHGLAGARVDRIARRADVNKAMLYYHFASKENLYRAIFENVIGQIVQVVGDSDTAAADIKTVLLALATQYHRLLGEDPRVASLFLHDMASGGELIREALKNTIEQRKLPEMLRTILEKGTSEGENRDVDVTQTLVSFIGMNLFYLLLSPLINAIWEIDDAKAFRDARPAAVVDLFIHGIATR